MPVGAEIPRFSFGPRGVDGGSIGRRSSMIRSRVQLFLFALTVFVGAALLFSLQLVYARLVLPHLGGAPSVWNTAMVFYQGLLLAGYGYAHLLTVRLRPTTQVMIHATVLVASFAFLPFEVPAGCQVAAGENPVPWLLGVLALGVGLPFFAVSATSPLLQKWFASSGHPAGGDPYFLYALSNIGSLLGLLAYPLWVEPHSSLGWQCSAWAGCFAGFAVLSVACGSQAGRNPPAECRARPAAPTRPGRVLRWLLCALVPSSLMLSVTSYLSGEIAAVPLLWSLPLALYLLSFIVVFARRPLVPHGLSIRLLPVVLVAVGMVLASGATTPVPWLAGLHLLGFFVVALVCHGELARDRPETGQLTAYYLWMSLGGVLGGAFTALLAPVLFDRVAEYPLVLVAAAWIGLPRGRRFRATDLAAPAGVAVLAVIMGALVPAAAPGPVRAFAVAGLPLLGCFLMSGYGPRCALGLAAVLGVSGLAPEQGMTTLARDRSFFGIHRVALDGEGKFHLLFHGKTVHGMQALDPALSRDPLGYYHREGPLGDVFAGCEGPVAAVGLGAGAMAAYGKAGQEFTFYEIDPVVIRLASDSRYFRYMSDSPARIDVVEGDARVMLKTAVEARYRLILLDAYSSDSIPVHLLTREAMGLYLSKLAPGGRLALHISNRHLDLRPVVADLARDADLVCLFREDDVTAEESAEGMASSRWVLMARDEADLGPAGSSLRWQRLAGSGEGRVWTDDHSSVLPLLDFEVR